MIYIGKVKPMFHEEGTLRYMQRAAAMLKKNHKHIWHGNILPGRSPS